MLDAQAKAKCKHRLNDLRQDLNEAKQFNDRDRAVQAQREMDWSQQQISDVQVGNRDRQSILVGESLQITARVHLGAVDPQHVRVEAYHGEVDNGDIRNPAATVLNQTGRADGDGNYIYEGAVPASESGTYGFSVRVVPTHPCLMQMHELRLITWS